MLMNLMPALREIRAPLAAGYILLAAAWLSIHDLLPNRVDSKGTLRTIHELIDSVGQGGVAVAASFLALLIGSVMQFIAEAIGRWRNTRRGGPQHDLRDPSSLVAYLGQMFADNPGLVQVAERETRIEEPERVTAHVVSAVSAEIPRIARRMRGTENELFDEYDRLIGEARFREIIIVPLAALTLVLAISWSWLFLVALLILPALKRQAVYQREAGHEVIVDALLVGKVAAPFPRTTGTAGLGARKSSRGTECSCSRKV